MENLNDRVNESKPHWMRDHEADDMRNFKSIQEILERIEKKLDPVFEAYQAATTMGRWAKMIIGFVLLVTTTWVAVKNLYYGA